MHTALTRVKNDVMKTRADFIRHCLYPFIPESVYSVYGLYQSTQPDSKKGVGGRLTGSPTATCFSLKSQFCEVKCFVSADGPLFFNFEETKKTIWGDIFSFLKEGDHLLVYGDIIDKRGYKQKERALDGLEIKNIKKIILLSVNKKEKALSHCTYVSQRQKDWFKFLGFIHRAVRERGLERISTPSLVDGPGTEPDLDLFETKRYSQSSSLSPEESILFLNTSPEIYMKRFLCRGWSDIYEIKKGFRNNEQGPINHNEFYLLEWYRAYSNLDVLLEDLYFLLNFLSEKIRNTPFPKLKKISMKELFKQYLNRELHPDTSREDFIHELKKRSIPFNASQEVEDLFYLLFLNNIEPYLDKETPLIVYDYPVFQKAYARIGEEGWALRFEFFWKGMELANAFDEVIKSEEQLERFQSDNLKRRKYGKKELPPAYSLLNDMEAGMPPSAGIALGLDRLFLAFKDLDDIKKIRFFI